MNRPDIDSADIPELIAYIEYLELQISNMVSEYGNEMINKLGDK